MSDDAGTIVLSGLTKRFGRVTAVDGLSFTAPRGLVTGFLGPNGAGKTTTLRMLAGLVIPDSGTATIGGRRYAALAAPGRQAGVVLEAAGFHPARTGRDHLRVYCTPAGIRCAAPMRCWRPAGWRQPGGGRCAATRWGCGSGWPWRRRCSANRPR